MSIYHTHHIVPKHVGGDNNPKNLINLTVSEHAAWHYELWLYYGYREDHLAWKALSGQIGKEEIFIEKSKQGGFWHKGKSETPETILKLKASKTGSKNPMFGRPVTDEHRLKNKLGHIGLPVPDPCRMYYFVDPNGTKTKIYNSTLFCQQNNLHLQSMRKIHNQNHLKSSYKGWTKWFL